MVQAAIDPAYINVWSEQESRQARRYEQYSFKTQRIDVRVEHDISLYHGLIHRTLDLIGESQWKHRDFGPHEDQEHWLIYYTLESHWPGLQRAQGSEPTSATLVYAAEYWRQYAARYAEIVAKASTLAELSWCALNMPALEAVQKQPPAPVRPQVVARAVPSQPLPEPVPPPATQAAQPNPKAIEPPPVVQSPAKPSLPASLASQPIWVMSEFLSTTPAAPPRQRPSESIWATSPDQPSPSLAQPVTPPATQQATQPASPWSPAQSIWATPAERSLAAAEQQNSDSTERSLKAYGEKMPRSK